MMLNYRRWARSFALFPLILTCCSGAQMWIGRRLKGRLRLFIKTGLTAMAVDNALGRSSIKDWSTYTIVCLSQSWSRSHIRAAITLVSSLMSEAAKVFGNSGSVHALPVRRSPLLLRCSQAERGSSISLHGWRWGAFGLRNPVILVVIFKIIPMHSLFEKTTKVLIVRLVVEAQIPAVN